jgi:hypothetical protein
VISAPQKVRPQAVDGQVIEPFWRALFVCPSHGRQVHQRIHRAATSNDASLWSSSDTAARIVCSASAQMSATPRSARGLLLAHLLYVLTDALHTPLPVPLDERMDCWPCVASVRPFRSTAMDVRSHLVRS